MIEERFQTHMERRRREEAENRATEFRELVLEPYVHLLSSYTNNLTAVSILI